MLCSLLQAQLCLSASVVDLLAVTNIVRSDLGLTIQLLRLAALETEQSAGTTAISEMVVRAGIEKLQALVAQTQGFPGTFGRSAGLSACERFWTHSRLIALIAEELAEQSSEVNPEEAYLAGLLCHVSHLPSILGWRAARPRFGESRHIGYRVAKAWGFPSILANLIGSYDKANRTRESNALLDLVEAADKWAARLESLAARESLQSGSLPTKQSRLEIPIEISVTAHYYR
jgi:HD-like signal output (HDOD) protein